MNLPTRIDNLASDNPYANWRDPQPLPEGLPSVSELDVALLPDNQSPRMVIRGESFQESPESGESLELYSTGYHVKYRMISTPLAKADAEPLAALTDYLNITFLFKPSQENMVQLVEYFRLFLGDTFASLQQRKGGLHGYKCSFAIGCTGGLFAYGDQRGMALVSLPASACALILDWPSCYHLFGEVLQGRITRWDGVVGLFDGEPSVDDAVEWYKAGKFNAGGNKPSCSQQGNWIETDGRGRTFYVGRRKNGKLLRIYEKGKQLGDKSSPWVRWEFELHNRDRIIPWEVLLEPGKYLAASYRCMGWDNVVQERIRTTRNTANVSYQHLRHQLSHSFGRFLTVMEAVEGSPEKVLQLLKRPGVPSRLSWCGESVAQFINAHDDTPA